MARLPHLPSNQNLQGVDMSGLADKDQSCTADGAVNSHLQPGVAAESSARMLPSLSSTLQLFCQYNVCGTVDLGVTVDLAQLSQVLPDAQHQNLATFNRCKLSWGARCGVTAFLFKTGKVNFMGAPRVSLVHRAAKEIGRLVRAAGYPDASPHNFQITNRVASANLPFALDLEKLASILADVQGSLAADSVPIDGQLRTLKYEPELFNGLRQNVYVQGKWVLVTVYQSGSIIINGVLKSSQFKGCVERLYPFLMQSVR